MRRTDIPAPLLDDVKNYLNVTWEDTATDNKIRDAIASGSMYLDKKGGEELDYEADGMPRTLLMEYVRYRQAEALDVFENNYTALILAMQNELAVKNSVESTQTTEKSNYTAIE